MEQENNTELNLADEILGVKLHYKTLMLEDDLKEVSQLLDDERINEEFKRSYTHIEDILHEEHGYSEREIESKLEDVFLDTKKHVGALIQRARSSEIQNKLFDVHRATERIVDLKSNYGSKEIEETDKLKDKILTDTKGVLENTPDNQSNTIALIEDAISTEMKQQIKRALDFYDDPRAEEASYDVSRYIDNRLLQNLIQGYLVGTESLNKSFEELYSDVLDEVIAEYSSEKDKQIQKNKDIALDEEEKTNEIEENRTRKGKFQESLQSATKTEDEIVRADIERHDDNTQQVEENKKKDENLITHVID